jgi:two-component system, chemotaxis family, sensor kinase CheA
MIDAHRQTFREEARELLADLESSLLDLEEAPDDFEAVGRIFRALHTIKGSGSMFGFDGLAAFTHEVETVFDLVRNSRIAVTKDLLDLSLAAGDQIRVLLDAPDGEAAADDAKIEEILSALKRLIPGEEPATGPVPQREIPAKAQEAHVTYRIRFCPHPDFFMKGSNPLLLLNELRELGECNVVAHTNSIPQLDEMNPEECFTCWDVILSSRCGLDAIKDVFIFVEDDCDLKIEIIDELACDQDGEPYKKLGEILIDRGSISPDDLRKVLDNQKRIGEMLLDAGLIDSSNLECALAEQKHVQNVRRKHYTEEPTSSIKVPAERLDTLVDLVGELVTVQARLTQTSLSRNDPLLTSMAEEVERLTAELRDNAMSIRMLPIGTTFNKFKRLVRDLSNELGKEVVLTAEGAETELDKTVIERLNDPLVHLIRNSIDHGIEPPSVREAAGKPRQGTVHLSAVHSGAHVLIRITDDGAGLDKEAIRAKAVEKGLIAPDVELAEKEVFDLILAPGFSTATKLSSVSGRGVGMDVVKRSIDALRGSIEISSSKSSGTTITLKLPLTLAIVDGLLVQVGEGYFVVPLSVVEECVELTQEDISNTHGRRMSYVRGEIVPYIRLRDRFAVNGGRPAIEQIVITEATGGRFGFVVDTVIGEHQTVIKSLGKMYRNVEGISGATILGDGTVALILDVPKLVREVEMEEQREDFP